MKRKPRYPDALRFNARPNPPDRFDRTLDDSPEEIEEEMQSAQVRDPEMRSNRRRSRAYGKLTLIGPWD